MKKRLQQLSKLDNDLHNPVSENATTGHRSATHYSSKSRTYASYRNLR